VGAAEHRLSSARVSSR